MADMLVSNRAVGRVTASFAILMIASSIAYSAS
jgi:hypothetical protein